jgi:hypothetical protein
MNENPPLDGRVPAVSKVSVWGSRKSPSWSIVVAEGTSDEELGRIVRRAVETWREVGKQLGEKPRDPLDEEVPF